MSPLPPAHSIIQTDISTKNNRKVSRASAAWRERQLATNISQYNSRYGESRILYVQFLVALRLRFLKRAQQNVRNFQ